VPRTTDSSRQVTAPRQEGSDPRRLFSAIYAGQKPVSIDVLVAAPIPIGLLIVVLRGGPMFEW
jgi:hypothetical protein